MKAIKVEVFIGAGDRYDVGLEHVVEMHNQIPKSQLAIFPNSDHLLLAESFLPFIQAAWRTREGGTRAVGSAVSASVARRGGGGKPSSPANDSVRGALGDSHAP
jgi:hypothetical protein